MSAEPFFPSPELRPPGLDTVGAPTRADLENPGEAPAFSEERGADVSGAVAEAVGRVERREDREPETGRFVAGNTAAGTTLRRSEALWSALAEAKGDLLGRLRSDLALAGDAAATMDAVLDGFAEASLLRRSLFIRLSELGGPITSKGKTRALVATYFSALDRETKLATTLGLRRVPKPVQSLDEFLAAKAAERQASE